VLDLDADAVPRDLEPHDGCRAGSSWTVPDGIGHDLADQKSQGIQTRRPDTRKELFDLPTSPGHAVPQDRVPPEGGAGASSGGHGSRPARQKGPRAPILAALRTVPDPGPQRLVVSPSCGHPPISLPQARDSRERTGPNLDP